MMTDRAEHRASHPLRLLRELVAHNDETDGEEHVNAERGKHLRPELQEPVVPCRVDDSHHQGRKRAEERGSGDEPAGGEPVHEEPDGQVEDYAHDEVREEV